MNVTHRIHAAALCATALAACTPAVDAPPRTLEPWPFTVDEVVLSCVPAPVPPGADAAAKRVLREHGSRVFVSTPDGRQFAVNGSARAEAPLMREIQAEIELRPLIDLGLGLCHGDQGGQIVLNAPQAGAQSAAVVAPQYRVERSAYGDGRMYIAEANQVIAGKRPTLTFACESGRTPMVMFNLVEPPNRPPPLRGVYATFIIGDQVQRLEMSWSGEEIWTLRDEGGRRVDAEFVQAALNQDQVTFHGERDFMPDAQLSWDTSRFDKVQFVEDCR